MATPILPHNGRPIVTVIDLIDYLSSLSGVKFSPELRDRLFSVVRSRSVKKLEFLLEEGEVSRHIFFIRRGILRCYYRHEDGSEVTAWLLREPNVVVAVNSFYKQKRSFEIIQAIIDTDLYYISYEELEAIYKEHPEFERVGRLLTIEYLIFWSMQLFNLRMHSAEERFDLWYKDDGDMLVYVQQKMVASYLNMEPETFSRIRKRYAK
ncbi:MAG: Crp/Fnr family transcriptional regulator [Bacteroidetes bacterium]|nr:Crp/Fnr family transcriptional regulator [Bacteroidota bacterium]